MPLCAGHAILAASEWQVTRARRGGVKEGGRPPVALGLAAPSGRRGQGDVSGGAMNAWGKILGGVFGYMLGGVIGALIGVAIGHAFDVGLRNVSRVVPRARAQGAFFTAVFSVLGHLSKADGRVNENEIRLAETLMDRMGLPGPLRARARDLFRAGKAPGFSLDQALDGLVRESRHNHDLMRIFLEVLLQSAYADGDLHREEERILRHVCERLGFSRREFEHLEAMLRGPGAHSTHRGPVPRAEMDVAHAYRVLDCRPDATDAEIKKSYRRLLNQHHPDKLVARGLPKELTKVAEERTVEIRKAYERLREARGF